MYAAVRSLRHHVPAFTRGGPCGQLMCQALLQRRRAFSSMCERILRKRESEVRPTLHPEPLHFFAAVGIAPPMASMSELNRTADGRDGSARGCFPAAAFRRRGAASSD